MNIAVLYGSSRANGNTELLVEHVIKDMSVRKVYLKDFHIKDIEDRRHEPGGFISVEDDYDEIMNTIMDCEILIFATPIYWYGMSGIMKVFIDRWSQVLRDVRYPKFKEEMSRKSAYIIAVGGDEPKIKGIPLIEQFNYICEFIGLDLKDYILGEGVKPNDILVDNQALEKANELKMILHNRKSISIH